MKLIVFNRNKLLRNCCQLINCKFKIFEGIKFCLTLSRKKYFSNRTVFQTNYVKLYL